MIFILWGVYLMWQLRKKCGQSRLMHLGSKWTWKWRESALLRYSVKIPQFKRNVYWMSSVMVNANSYDAEERTTFSCLLNKEKFSISYWGDYIAKYVLNWHRNLCVWYVCVLRDANMPRYCWGQTSAFHLEIVSPFHCCVHQAIWF